MKVLSSDSPGFGTNSEGFAFPYVIDDNFYVSERRQKTYILSCSNPRKFSNFTKWYLVYKLLILSSQLSSKLPIQTAKMKPEWPIKRVLKIKSKIT